MGVHVESPNHRINVQVLQVLTSFGPLNRDLFRAYLSDPPNLGIKGHGLKQLIYIYHKNQPNVGNYTTWMSQEVSKWLVNGL